MVKDLVRIWSEFGIARIWPEMFKFGPAFKKVGRFRPTLVRGRLDCVRSPKTRDVGRIGSKICPKSANVARCRPKLARCPLELGQLRPILVDVG